MLKFKNFTIHVPYWGRADKPQQRVENYIYYPTADGRLLRTSARPDDVEP